MTEIRRAVFPDDEAAVLGIWREYIASSPVDLAYQNNEAEFATLSAIYAAPEGCVLLADEGEDTIGCIALRRSSATICEMKRLYVRPQARSGKLGERLVAALIAEARAFGYREMRLDVKEKFLLARRLYADFGFTPAAPIAFNPVAGASFLGLRL